MASSSSSVIVLGTVTDTKTEWEWQVLDAGEGMAWPDIVYNNSQQVIFRNKERLDLADE